MGTTYGKQSILVTPDLIEDIIIDTTGRTTYTIGTETNGAAIVTATMLFNTANGCSSNNGIFIRIKDVIPWRKIYVSFISTGVASCWGWNGNNGYGAGMTSSQQQGNLLSYNASLGDFTRNEFNVWNLPQFRKYFSACDNNSDNYMHGSFAVGTSRGFDIYSRRNNMGVLAGPSHGRTCMNNGTITMTNMRIMY
jgi:hypothetical protein